MRPSALLEPPSAPTSSAPPALPPPPARTSATPWERRVSPSATGPLSSTWAVRVWTRASPPPPASAPWACLTRRAPFCPQGVPVPRGMRAEAQGGLPGDERTAVVVVDHGSRRAESNANLDAFVEVFQSETGYTIVEPAHMELAKPTIADAFSKCVARGAQFIIVCPYFLAPGRHWSQDIPSLCAEAAQLHPGIQYIVTAPIGAHPLVAHVLNERIQTCLRRSTDEGEACSACDGKASGCQVLGGRTAGQHSSVLEHL